MDLNNQTGNIPKEKADKVIGGVCLKLGEYFKIDPLVFRIIFVSLFLFWGLGAVLYLILSALIPSKAVTDSEDNTQDIQDAGNK